MNAFSTAMQINAAAIDISGEWVTAAVSGVALIGSFVSLWQTTLKQPQLSVYVSDNIHYTRDPYGPFEVLAVPLTIVNGGARDGVVLSMQLLVKNTTIGQTEPFKAAYTVDAQYFGSREDLSQRIKRPKIPFAPLSVAGRHAYTGTILFYRGTGGDKNLIEAAAEIEMLLSLVAPAPDNLFDRMLTADPRPVLLRAQVPSFYPGALLTGDNAPLKVISGAV